MLRIAPLGYVASGRLEGRDRKFGGANRTIAHDPLNLIGIHSVVFHVVKKSMTRWHPRVQNNVPTQYTARTSYFLPSVISELCGWL